LFLITNLLSKPVSRLAPKIAFKSEAGSQIQSLLEFFRCPHRPHGEFGIHAIFIHASHGAAIKDAKREENGQFLGAIRASSSHVPFARRWQR
jgi:hypothetical protein